MRQITREKIHCGYPELWNVCFLIRTVVWSGKGYRKFVQPCPVCQSTIPPTQESPDYYIFTLCPWEHIARDLFEVKGFTYLLVVDYYS